MQPSGKKRHDECIDGVLFECTMFECTGSKSAEGRGPGHVHSMKASGTFPKVGPGETTHNTGVSAPQYSAWLDAWLYALHCMCMTRHWSSPFDDLEHT